MSFSSTAIASVIERGVDVVVCGHIHRVGQFEVEAGSRRGQVYTLGAWGERGSYLVPENGRFEFEEFVG